MNSAVAINLGVIGHPVAHSISPQAHRAALDYCGLAGTYGRFDVIDDDDVFKAFVGGDRFDGLSVTLPHKVRALGFADVADPITEMIGAANTLVMDSGGAITAGNTDYDAILDALCSSMDVERRELNRVTAIVLGAGGAARAAVAGLAHWGAQVTVFNRTGERAAGLAREFGVEFGDWSDRGRLRPGIVINATSVGMSPRWRQSPFPAASLVSGQVVFDMVYNPLRTRLLVEAGNAGCRTIDGLTMFVRQAASQFMLFTGRCAPLDVMRSAALAALAG